MTERGPWKTVTSREIYRDAWISLQIDDVIRPDGGSDAEHSARRDAGSAMVHDIAARLGGSISAEHGLGSMKTEEARRFKSPVELAALTAIRQSLDPKRIMNPRVLF